MPGTYLIAGSSASGKSTIGQHLAGLGYEVIDADEQFGYFGNLQAMTPAIYPRKLTRQWLADNGWLWDVIKLEAVLSTSADGPRFIVGGARNERRFYGYFNKLFLLHIPDDVLVQRLRSRTGGHTNNDIVIKRMRLLNLDTYEHARNINAQIIETDRPMEACINDIIAALPPGERL
jgi:gluconate kinase